MNHPLPILRGRGANLNPPNRFTPLILEPDPEGAGCGDPAPNTRFFEDSSRSIIAHNDSPDVGFEFSINPYRGCEHGCTYCYARNSHEFLGLSAGLDFETKIFVKTRAPELLRRELNDRRWVPQSISISGVTDAYQPVERRLQLTRQCIQVLAEFRNPAAVITKSHLITRDIDLLGALARHGAAAAMLSITTLDPDLSAAMEPRAAAPARRIAAIAELARAGIPTGIMVSPVIPGLTDHELPAILQAAAEAGASFCGFAPVRLPGAVAGVFEDWLRRHYPDRAGKVLGRIRAIRQGRLNDSSFHTRMRGRGPMAEQIADLYRLARRRAGLDRPFPGLSAKAFQRRGEQIPLFPE